MDVVRQLRFAINFTDIYLSMKTVCSDKFGIFMLNTSVLPLNSFASGCVCKLLDKEAHSSCTLIAESNPAVTRREEIGSYKHRHMPLPLYNNKAVNAFQILSYNNYSKTVPYNWWINW